MKIASMKALPLALAFVALAGCDAMKRDQASTDAMDRSGTTASTSYDTSAGMTGSATAVTAGTGGTQAGQDMSTMQPNAVVVSIEPMTRSSAMVGASSAGTTGGSATGSPSDRVHRVTVRMDDGSTRVLVQETAPAFQSGDRVAVANDMIYRR